MRSGFALPLAYSIPLTVGWMIRLGTVNGFLGLNNRSYWPHSGDNTLSSFCPFLRLSLTLCHIHTQSRGEMAYVFIELFMDSICLQFHPKMLLRSKLLRCVIHLLCETANSQFYHVFSFWQWFCVCSAIPKTG